VLTRAFGFARERVTQALTHRPEPPENRGRHLAIPPEIEQQTLQWIEHNAAKGTTVTVRDVREHLSSCSKSAAARGWVNSFLGRHADRLCKAKIGPQEAQLLEIPRCFLEETVRRIAQHVQGRPTELVFNLDEVGISEWEVRKVKKMNVIVPRSSRGQTIHHKINRRLKHLSVIACVSAAGESLTPYIVTSQDSPVVRAQLKKRCVRFGTAFLWKSRAKPYTNAEIFEEDIHTVFLPNLDELRNLEEFAAEDVILLMDNCPGHMGEVILNLLRDSRVRVITWLLYTTPIFQELDISLFGVLKRREQSRFPFNEDDGTGFFLLRTSRTFKQTMIEGNIWGAFQEAGLEFDASVEPYRIRFDEEKLRRSPRFEEIWHLDFPLEKLSTRRQNARFSWINQ
jgi:hypothetical protein